MTRPLRPRTVHATSYPHLSERIGTLCAVGISAVLGVSQLVPATAQADPPPHEVRLGGIAPPPNYPPPPPPPPTPAQVVTNSVTSWSVTAYLNDGSYAGVSLQIIPEFGADLSFLTHDPDALNAAVVHELMQENCHGMDLVALADRVRAVLNAIDPTGTWPIASVVAIQNFCEPHEEFAGDLAEPDFH